MLLPHAARFHNDPLPPLALIVPALPVIATHCPASFLLSSASLRVGLAVTGHPCLSCYALSQTCSADLPNPSGMLLCNLLDLEEQNFQPTSVTQSCQVAGGG